MRVSPIVQVCLLATLAFAIAVAVTVQQFPKQQQNHRVERPPLAPPNCDASADLSSITDRDGKVVDVRIISVRSTRLYVPTNWLHHDLIDEPENKYSAKFDIREQFSPDLHRNECPGVHHRFITEGATPAYGSNRGDVTDFGLDVNFAPDVLADTGVAAESIPIGVEAAVTPEGREKQYPRNSSVSFYWIRHNKDIFLRKYGPVIDIDKRKYEEELHRLADWLMESPATRDNSLTFFPSSRFP